MRDFLKKCTITGSLEMEMQHQAERDRDRADYLSQKENRYMVKSERKKHAHEKMALMGSHSAHASGTATPISYIGVGGNAIAAAASQAIAATQQVALFFSHYDEKVGTRNECNELSNS